MPDHKQGAESLVEVTQAGKKPLRLPDLTPKQIARLWSNVDMSDHSGCWLWTGRLSGNSTHKYGDFTVGRRHVRPHRLIYQMTNGGLHTDQVIDHLCRNPVCVNPDHLEAVSPTENVLRGNSYPTHCVNGHALAGANVRSRGVGVQRACRRCGAARTAKYRAKKREQHNG